MRRVDLAAHREKMAKCEEGYLCQVCGKDVESITDSDLYLRYVIGLVDPETLHTSPERHINCNPALAQFIVDDRFAPVVVDDDCGKQHLDPEYVQQREQLVTRGYRRLHELTGIQDLSVLEFPLPEVVQKMTGRHP